MAKRYSQPQSGSGAQIDWANPITRGLSRTLNQPAISSDWSFTGNRASYVGVDGVAVELTSIYATSAVSGSEANGFSLYAKWVVVSGSTADVASLFNGASYRTLLYVNGSNKLYVFYNGATATQVHTATIGGGDRVSLVLAYSAGSIKVSATVNGVTQNTTISVTLSGSYTSFNVGGRFTANTTRVVLANYWNRALSDAEIKSLSENPWSLFRAANSPIFVPVSAPSGSVSLTPDAGTIAFTGYEPTITRTGSSSTTVTPDVGTVTLTGNQPTVTQTANQSVTAGVGTVAITGYAPTVQQTANQAVTAGVGSLTITGYAPTVDQSASGTIQPGTGSVTFTGNAPTVTQTANQVITAGVGTVSITGYAPTVTSEAIVTPAAGDLTINGYAPTVQQTANQVVVPGFGTFTIDGWVPTVTRTADTETIARPSSDISAGSWLPSSVGAGLYEMVDEVVPSDADYIYATSVGAVCEMAMNPTVFPGSPTSQQLKYRASSSTGNSVIVRVKDVATATVIRSETQTLSPVDTEYVVSLLPGEIALITSGILSVELEAA